MAKPKKRRREKVVDYSAPDDTGIRLVVRLLRYECPPQATHRQYAPVPGHAAKLTVENTAQLEDLWTLVNEAVAGFAWGRS